MSSGRDDTIPILRPVAKHGWQLTPMSTEPPTPRSPSTEPPSSSAAAPASPAGDADKPPPRSRSILNLTSSTLFGIYSSAAGDSGSSREDISQPGTPWGAQTPATPWSPTSPLSSSQTASIQVAAVAAAADGRRGAPAGTSRTAAARRRNAHRRSRAGNAGLALRNAVALFGLGVAYGAVVSRLHDEPALGAVRVEAVQRAARSHLLAFWGCAGAALGLALPWLDAAWARALGAPERGDGDEEEDSSRTDWVAVMRGVGAFVGIAFAIRRLPWESTLQASLTLALSNPVLWYLVDRSATGLLLSTAVSFVGCAAVLGSGGGSAGYVPSPVAANATALLAAVTGLGDPDRVAAATWVASVLFYCCVCFGNIGRVLAVR